MPLPVNLGSRQRYEMVKTARSPGCCAWDWITVLVASAGSALEIVFKRRFKWAERLRGLNEGN